MIYYAIAIVFVNLCTTALILYLMTRIEDTIASMGETEDSTNKQEIK